MGAPEPHGYMGWWGHMGGPKQRGIVTYAVSSYAQKPFAGALYNAFFNTFRRVSSQALYVVLPVSGLVYVVNKAQARNEFLYSKAGREELEAMM
ncbi:ubiquinol cytochrome C reductase subunit 8 [Myxozyma melibiosi]|uniref:Cytochrome b-c1 complex subunit 8 n=1 Tax=Myxozyma melibiosi TaxID=54550 RepID=A0ABR1F2V0_9ASCO